MNERRTNIIRKQVLNLRYKDKADGFALQKEFTDWYYRELFPEMQSLIDQLAPDHIHVRLDKLKLDLVITGTNEWKQVLRKQAMESLREKLHHEIQYNAPVEKDKLIGAEENFFAILKYYLQKGFLPWWSTIEEKKEFDTVLEEWLSSGDTKKYIPAIKEVLKDKQAVYRMAVLLDEKGFEDFIQFLSGSETLVKNVRQLHKEIEKMTDLLPGEKRRSFILLLKQVVLEIMNKPAAGQKVEMIITGFVNRLITQFPDEIIKIDWRPIHFEKLKRAVAEAKEMIVRERRAPATEQENELSREKQTKTSSGKTKDLPGKKQEVTREEDQQKNDKKEDINEESAFKDKTSDEQNELNIPSKNKTKEPRKNKEEMLAEIREGIFVHNAGLVVVASFLPMLFKKLLLVDGNVITDKNKAVMLVQYLASGKEYVAEFELGLAKILCGLEMETAVDTNIILSEEEKQEANELLLSAIEYWSILGNTSVQGLRDSFLVRDGKLSFDKDEWLLQVEQKPYDMLLQNLPWNISMIKLAWMPYILKTEWFN